MEVLNTFFVAPVADMIDSPIFLLEVIIGGILAGVMYSLVALGFVLIYKASGVFNYAQGAMVLFAALTLVGLMEHSVPLVLAILLTMAIMVGCAFIIERWVLRPLVNQAQIILFMAMIGLRVFLLSPNLFGAAAAGWAMSGLALMVAIVNRGVASGGGDGSNLGLSVWALIARYAVLLTKQATSLASFGFLELTAIALAVASIGATAKAAVTAWGVEEEEEEE